jgi:hypothetical protein
VLTPTLTEDHLCVSDEQFAVLTPTLTEDHLCVSDEQLAVLTPKTYRGPYVCF